MKNEQSETGNRNLLNLRFLFSANSLEQIHTHTHTHVYIYDVYINENATICTLP
jgi:hypothetical protein